MSLNDEVRAAVARWWKLEGPCRGVEIEPGAWSGCLPDTPDGTMQDCPGCHGSGGVQPAPVKALIEAVTQKCPVIGTFDFGIGGELCNLCWGTGRVPRDWEEIGEYALWGALVGVANDYPVLADGLAWLRQPDNPYLHVRQQVNSAFDEWVVQTRDAFYPGSLALADVNEALEQM